MLSRPVVVLDRDGVLNRMVVDPEHGTIDSPLHPSQVEILPGVCEGIARLRAAGFDLAIASNQPAAAKGKTTRGNLEAVHREVLVRVGAEDLEAHSHLCFHRAQDDCACRKPRPGLLEKALAGRSPEARSRSWMVGDGLVDLDAGVAAGLLTAFLAPRKCSACRVLEERRLRPAFWGESLLELSLHLEKRPGSPRLRKGCAS